MLPVAAVPSGVSVGPRAIIASAYRSMNDQCASTSSSRSAAVPGLSRQ
jgi:hypothetical protein